MKVSLIAAVARNGTIGRDGDLPWRIRDDMRFFMTTTRGHVVVTGRLNYEAMGKALAKRHNLVVTRNPSWQAPDADRAGSIEQALQMAERTGETEAFVIGGAQIYRLALPYAHCFYRTRVLAEVEGHVFFPEFDEQEWSARVLFEHEADEDNEHPFVVEELTRKAPPASYA